MPASKLVPYQEVLKDLDISRPTLWRMVRAGTLPKPVYLSPGRRGFFRDEYEAYLEQLRASRG